MSLSLLPLLLVGLAQDPPPSASEQAMEPQRGLQTILWLFGGPPRDADFYRTVAGLGFTAVSVSTGEDPSVPGRHGLGFYLDQAAGKGVLELRDRQWRPVRDAYEHRRQPGLLERPSCLSDLDVQGALSRGALARLSQALSSGPLAVSLGDEISITRHANPLDLCFGPRCVEAFRAALARRYGRIDSLNAAWETSFADFASVRPLTADQIRRRELGSAYLPGNLRPWAEHREFMDALLAKTVADLVEKFSARAPGLASGLTGIQPPSAYGGHDYRRLLPNLSFYEAYDIGGARDLAMSLAPSTARQVLTLFPPGQRLPAEMTRARIADALAHGLWGVVVWSAGEVFRRALEPSAYGAQLARGFAEFAAVGEAFAGAELSRSNVWLGESQATVRAWWMLDSADDGDTWIRRLSSYEATHSTSLAARHGWIRLCEDLGLQPLLVPEEELSRRLLRDRPRLLVLPACIAMSDGAVRAVSSFVAQGGVVVADHTPALYDQDLQLRDRPALDDLFGVTDRSLRRSDLLVRGGAPAGLRLPTGSALAERGLRAELAEPLGDEVAQLEKAHHRGRAFYLNLVVAEYGRVRLDPSPESTRTAVDLRRRLRPVLERARVRAPVVVRSVSGTGLPAVVERMELRGRSGQRLLAVRLNALESPSLMQSLVLRGPQRVSLFFPSEVHPIDLIRGEDLGVARSFEVNLDPVSGLFLELRPTR